MDESLKNINWPAAPDTDTFKQVSDSEYWVACPFDTSHRALNTKFGSHLAKCRRNYQDWKLENNELLEYVHCRYDSNHKVLPPELEIHEYVCKQEYMEGAALTQALYRNEMKNFKGPWQDFQPDILAQEAFKIFNAKPRPLTAIPEGVVVWADPEETTKVQLPYHATTAFENLTLADPEEMGATAGLTMPPAMFSRYSKESHTKESGEVPKHDWLKKWSSLEAPMRSFPPGLSKSQRKKFEGMNDVRMKTEQGVLSRDGSTFDLSVGSTSPALVQAEDKIRYPYSGDPTEGHIRFLRSARGERMVVKSRIDAALALRPGARSPPHALLWNRNRSNALDFVDKETKEDHIPLTHFSSGERGYQGRRLDGAPKMRLGERSPPSPLPDKEE